MIMSLNEVKAYLEEKGAKFIHIGILSSNMGATIDALEAFPFVGKFVPHRTTLKAEDLEVGAPYVVEIANAEITSAGFVLEILSPIEEESDPDNIYSVLLREYGDGLSHIAYSVPSFEVFQEALDAFLGAGYKMILRGGVRPNPDKGIKGNAFVYLDPDNGKKLLKPGKKSYTRIYPVNRRQGFGYIQCHDRKYYKRAKPERTVKQMYFRNYRNTA